VTAGTLGWLVLVTTVLAVAAMAVALGAVFFYKQRETQARVVIAAQGLDLLLLAVLAGALGFVAFRTDADLTEAGAVGFAVLLLPVFAYVALYLAKRAIQRDVDLVRSMDRLR
jgi:hypothetical protein